MDEGKITLVLAATRSQTVASRSGGDRGADARIRNIASTGEVLSRGRLDHGALDVETTSIDALGTAFVVAAGIQRPEGGYVARFG